MTPLAIGQERSVKLIEDVVAGDRLLALVTVRDEEVEVPGWDALYEVGTDAVVTVIRFSQILSGPVAPSFLGEDF